MKILALELEHGKYFIVAIDKYSNFFKRTISDFEKVHRIKSIKYVIKHCDQYDLDKYVRIFMDVVGVSNVRGGSFSSLILGKEIIQCLEIPINSTYNIEQHLVNPYDLSKIAHDEAIGDELSDDADDVDDVDDEGDDAIARPDKESSSDEDSEHEDIHINKRQKTQYTIKERTCDICRTLCQSPRGVNIHKGHVHK
jgi:hypothetical protein